MDIWTIYTLYCAYESSHEVFIKAIVSLSMKTQEKAWIISPCKKTAPYFAPATFTKIKKVIYSSDHITIFILCGCGNETHSLTFYNLTDLYKQIRKKHTLPYYVNHNTIMMGYYRPLSNNDIYIGNIIEAIDLDGIWYHARILSITNELIKIHYMCWSDTYDEWIRRDSPRLAQMKTHLPPLFTPNLHDHVDFQYSQRWYHGVILSVSNNIFTIQTFNDLHQKKSLYQIVFNGENITWAYMHTSNEKQYRLEHNILSTKWDQGHIPVYICFNRDNINVMDHNVIYL